MRLSNLGRASVEGFFVQKSVRKGKSLGTTACQLMGPRGIGSAATFALFLLAMFPTCLWASDGKVDTQRFVDEIGRSIKISVHQEIPGFVNALYKLDAGELLLEGSEDWGSFWDGDAWVYFISNESEVGFLPYYVRGFVEELGTTGKDQVLFSKQQFDDQLGNSKTVFVFVVFVENLAASRDLDPACLSAAFVYSVLQNRASVENRRRLSGLCSK